ncbi:unnamed protein product [Caenorhabditis angaria]|uniref:Uncharacterized protein n=1 Tax=Caenorhabditis angaria TaxID=860376 RepID=A0A9P1I620_9PELO|nr:unnamed protein product [Caenorhabditis angaria]
MAEDESKNKKQIKNERSDENLKIKKSASDDKGNTKMKKSSSRDVITRRKSKTRKLTPVLDLSKRLQNSFRKTNDTKFRLLYNRAKNKSQNKMENPEENVKILDVPGEYDAIASESENGYIFTVSEGPMNNENNGRLFINGVPFWATKEEKPPNSGTVQVSDALKELLEKKLTLVKEIPKPQDLDKYHELPTMTSRDKEYFETPNRILSNTIRALVVTNGNVKRSNTPGSIKPSIVGFQVPDVVYIYNRKNRMEEMKTVKFVQGTFVKKKKSILSNFLDYIY